MLQGHMLGHILPMWDFKYQQNGEKGFIFVLTNVSKKKVKGFIPLISQINT